MKKGFTLIELLVYMAIMGFIIVVAGRAYSDATSMRVRTQSMTKATEEARRIAEIIKEDMSQMGAKVLGEKKNDEETTNDSDHSFITKYDVYMDKDAADKDSSSFNLSHEVASKYDNIEFKKISYKENGEYMGIRVIKWYVINGTLYRSCRTTIEPSASSASDPELAACPATEEAAVVAMAENVQKFIFNPSKPLDNTSAGGLPFGGAPTAGNPAPTFGLISRVAVVVGDFYAVRIAQPTAQPTADYNTAILSGNEQCGDNRYCFIRNTDETGRKQQQVYVADPLPPISECKKFAFKKNETYAVKFKTPINLIMGDNGNIPDSMMALFQPSVDHMSVNFRKPNGDTIFELPKDFTFYPPQKTTNEDGTILILNTNQYFEFSVPKDVSNACVAFTFAFYSGSDGYGPHKGRLRIKDFELLHKKDRAYQFVREVDPDYGTYLNIKENKKNVKAFELILEVKKGSEFGSTRKCWKEEGEDTEVCGGYVIPVPNNGIVPQVPQ